MNCKKCGNPLPENENFCKICDTVQDETIESAPLQPPMRCYKFIVYFGLPVSALFYLIYAIFYAFGLIRRFDYTSVLYAQWGDTYDSVPFLRALDIPFGVCCLGLAAFCIVALVFLLLRKKSAPSCFFAMFTTSLIVSIALLFIDYAVRLSIFEQTGQTAPSGYAFFTFLLIWVAIEIGVLCLLTRYFNKRLSYFDQ